jgi:hypothetical protein
LCLFFFLFCVKYSLSIFCSTCLVEMNCFSLSLS